MLASILIKRSWASIFHGNEAKRHWQKTRKLEQMLARGHGKRGGLVVPRFITHCGEEMEEEINNQGEKYMTVI